MHLGRLRFHRDAQCILGFLVGVASPRRAGLGEYNGGRVGRQEASPQSINSLRQRFPLDRHGAAEFNGRVFIRACAPDGAVGHEAPPDFPAVHEGSMIGDRHIRQRNALRHDGALAGLRQRQKPLGVDRRRQGETGTRRQETFRRLRRYRGRKLTAQRRVNFRSRKRPGSWEWQMSKAGSGSRRRSFARFPPIPKKTERTVMHRASYSPGEKLQMPSILRFSQPLNARRRRPRCGAALAPLSVSLRRDKSVFVAVELLEFSGHLLCGAVVLGEFLQRHKIFPAVNQFPFGVGLPLTRLILNRRCGTLPCSTGRPCSRPPLQIAGATLVFHNSTSSSTPDRPCRRRFPQRSCGRAPSDNPVRRARTMRRKPPGRPKWRTWQASEICGGVAWSSVFDPPARALQVHLQK